MSNQTIILLGLVVIFAGLLVAVLAMILPALRRGRLSSKGGAVVIIGPFPIVVGSDWRLAGQLLVLAIILVAALVLLYLIRIV